MTKTTIKARWIIESSHKNQINLLHSYEDTLLSIKFIRDCRAEFAIYEKMELRASTSFNNKLCIYNLNQLITVLL